MIQQTIKGYNNIKNTNYNDFITSIINNNSKENYKTDTDNLKNLLNDINIVYNEYFNGKITQKGGGSVDDTADTCCGSRPGAMAQALCGVGHDRSGRSTCFRLRHDTCSDASDRRGG